MNRLVIGASVQSFHQNKLKVKPGLPVYAFCLMQNGPSTEQCDKGSLQICTKKPKWLRSRDIHYLSNIILLNGLFYNSAVFNDS